jgi:hypothetical protein
VNKKILAKTLLPIVSVVLIGGGIASSFVLTSCSNDKEVILSSSVAAENYIRKHARVFPSNEFHYNAISKITEVYPFYDFACLYYDKQAFINGEIAECLSDGGSFFDNGGKIILNKNI